MSQNLSAFFVARNLLAVTAVVRIVSSYIALMRASGNQMFQTKSHANRPCTSYSVHQLSDGVLGLARTVTLRTRSLGLYNDLRSIKSDYP